MQQSPKPSFVARLRSATDMLLGRVPQAKSELHPFFWGNFLQFSGMPQQKADMNYQRLRSLAESPVPRRAIRYIKSQVSQLDKEIVPKKGAKITAQQKKQIKALNNMFNSPNAEDSWVIFIEKVIEDLLVLGWSTVEVKEWKDNPEHPLLLYPADAASFQIYLDWNGSPSQRKYAQFDLRGGRIDFLPGELWVTRFDSRSSDPFGFAPLASCANEVEFLLQAMAYSNSVASSAHPKKALFLGEDADNEFVRETRAYWRDEIDGRGGMPILGGTKAPTSIELGADSDESLFLKWQNHLIALIAMTFGLDIQKMNQIMGINRSTSSELDDVTDEGSIRPICALIADSINNYFLRRYGLYDVAEFQFKFTNSNTDLKAKAVLCQINLQADLWTIDEARAEMGFPPLPDGKGQYTLSVYRGKFAQTNNVNLSEEVVDGSSTPQDKGKNGAHGASKSKDAKADMNKGTEKNTDAPKPIKE